MEPSPGTRLARLLLAGFDALVAEATAELTRRGHPGVTAPLEFALQAVDGGADSAAALGRSLGMSRQGAAKAISALTQLGYLDVVPDPADARRKRLRVTARGHEMTTIGREAFDAARARWAAGLPAGRAEQVEEALLRLVPSPPEAGRGGGDAEASEVD